MKCLSHKQRDQKRTVCGYSACVICTWLNQGKNNAQLFVFALLPLQRFNELKQEGCFTNGLK